MTVTETTTGDKPKKEISVSPSIWTTISSLPSRLIRLFFSRQNTYSEVTDSEWTDWYPFPTDGHKIKRKVIAETGFDNCIKFYKLRTADKRINDLLLNKIFGDFHWEKDYGIFLRQFDDPNDWPLSFLVFIDTTDFSYHRLKKVNSSWSQWTYEHVNEIDFNIITGYTKTHKTRLEIRN